MLAELKAFLAQDRCRRLPTEITYETPHLPDVRCQRRGSALLDGANRANSAMVKPDESFECFRRQPGRVPRRGKLRDLTMSDSEIATNVAPDFLPLS